MEEREGYTGDDKDFCGLQLEDLTESQLRQMPMEKLLYFVNKSSNILADILLEKLSLNNVNDVAALKTLCRRAYDLDKILKEDNVISRLAKKYNNVIRENRNKIPEEDVRQMVIWDLLDKDNKLKEFKIYLDNNEENSCIRSVHSY